MKRPFDRARRGATLVMVLLVLAVTLLGGLMLARAGLVDTLLAGNVSRAEAAAQATDIGISTAFEDLNALTDLETAKPGWYFPLPVGDDSDGLPTLADWTGARAVQAGASEVRYVIERLCRSTPVTDEFQQCLMNVSGTGGPRNATSGEEAVTSAAQRSYRVTVRVTGPRNTLIWAQALLTRP